MARYFDLPIFDDLTIEQQAALNETAPLALSGGPGTGKSVVSLWRHIRNYEIGEKKSMLLTYTKTLEHYLKGAAESYNQESSDNIDRTYYWLTYNKLNYDEIIIDEAQDVSVDKIKKVKIYSQNISYAADDKQKLYSRGCEESELEKVFPKNIKYTLRTNFRNSKEIIEFTRSVFINTLIPQDVIHNKAETGNKPILIITNGDINIELDTIMSIISDYSEETHNIGILVTGRKSVGIYHELISKRLDDPTKCTKYENTMPHFQGMERIHVTTFKSSKGIEFDTVIIPGFDRINWMIECSNTISDKDYYVAITRAKKNLLLLCKNRPLKADLNTLKIEEL